MIQAILSLFGGATDAQASGRKAPPGFDAALLGVMSPADRPASGRVGTPYRDPELARLAPELRTRLERVIARMRGEFGHDVQVVEGWRSAARQEYLFAQGRSRPGPVVTWTHDSAHEVGLAADLMVNGGYGDPEAYRTLQRIAREEGLTTLGLQDPGHVELPDTGMTATPAGPGGPADQTNRPLAADRSRTIPDAGVARVATVARVANVARVAPVSRVALVARVATPGSLPPVGRAVPEAGAGIEAQPDAPPPGGTEGVAARTAEPPGAPDRGESVDGTSDAEPLNRAAESLSTDTAPSTEPGAGHGDLRYRAVVEHTARLDPRRAPDGSRPARPTAAAVSRNPARSAAEAPTGDVTDAARQPVETLRATLSPEVVDAGRARTRRDPTPPTPTVPTDGAAVQASGESTGRRAATTPESAAALESARHAAVETVRPSRALAAPDSGPKAAHPEAPGDRVNRFADTAARPRGRTIGRQVTGPATPPAAAPEESRSGQAPGQPATDHGPEQRDSSRSTSEPRSGRPAGSQDPELPRAERGTTRTAPESTQPRVIEPRTTAEPGQLRAPRPASGVMAPDRADVAGRVDAIDAARARSEAQPLRRVSLRVGEGHESARVRVDLQGDAVRADLGSRSARLAQQMGQELPELTRALERQGVEMEGLRVRQGERIVADVSTPRAVAESTRATEPGSSSRNEGTGSQRHAHEGRDRRRERNQEGNE